MNRIRWYGPSLLVLITVALVMGFGPNRVRDYVYANDEAQIKLVREQLESNPLLDQLSHSFRQVALAVQPSVVHIQVYSKSQPREIRQRFSPDDLRRFFEGRPPLDDMQPDTPEEDHDMDKFNRERPLGNGSGWVWDESGHIITNYHVVKDADKIEIKFNDDDTRVAKLVGADPKTDIAVLNVEGGKLHPAMLATEEVEQGDIVFAFGSPFRFQFSMSQGIVSAKGRELGIIHDAQGMQGYEDFIQTDAAINPGNSGGPLTNARGEVVGMSTAIATRTGSNNGLGFAIPVDMIRDVVEQILTHGRVARGYLGIWMRDVTAAQAATYGYDQGKSVVVEEIIDKGPAQKAGLKRGDLIIKVNDTPIHDSDHLRFLVAKLKPDTKITVNVWRDNKFVDVDVTLGDMRDSSMQIAGRGNGEDQPEAQADEMQLLRKMGIESITTMTEQAAERLRMDFVPGVLIRQVRPESIAAAEGLTSGMVINQIGGEKVQTITDLINHVNEHKDDELLRLSVVDRTGRSRFVFLEVPKE